VLPGWDCRGRMCRIHRPTGRDRDGEVGREVKSAAAALGVQGRGQLLAVDGLAAGDEDDVGGVAEARVGCPLGRISRVRGLAQVHVSAGPAQAQARAEPVNLK
jgi:hypothetical protein